MPKFEYEALDMQEIAAEAQRASTKGNQKSRNDKYFYLEKDGYAILRFLPRKKNTRFFQETRIHPLFIGGQKRMFHCARVLTVKPDGKKVWMPPSDGPDCVICKYYHHLWQKGERAGGKDTKEGNDLQNQARKLRPYERFYYNVVVREYLNPATKKVETNVGPLIFSCGKELHGKILMHIKGDPTKGLKPLGDISHPVTGRDFRYVKTTVTGSRGEQYPSYDHSTFEDVCPAGTEDEMVRWMNSLHDLAALRDVKDEETLTKALKIHLGVLPAEDDDFDYSQFEGGHQGDSENTEDVTMEALSQQAARVSARVEAEPPAAAKKPLVKQEKPADPAPTTGKKPAATAAQKGGGLDLAADPEFMAELDALEEEGK